MKVLLVDDTKIVHQLVRVYLTGLQLDFEDAYGGTEGLAKVRDGDYNLVICDLAMPDLDGLELCRQLRSDPHARLNGLPFILLTSHTEPVNRLAARQVGVTEFVGKPIDEAALVGAVKRVLHLA